MFTNGPAGAGGAGVGGAGVGPGVGPGGAGGVGPGGAGVGPGGAGVGPGGGGVVPPPPPHPCKLTMAADAASAMQSCGTLMAVSCWH